MFYNKGIGRMGRERLNVYLVFFFLAARAALSASSSALICKSH